MEGGIIPSSPLRMRSSIAAVLLLVLVNIALSRGAATPLPKMINIDYLGSGYDIFKGNPHSEDDISVGFRESIFQLTYALNSVTADGLWLQPDNVKILQTPQCTFNSNSMIMTGTTSYQATLAVDASVTGGGNFGEVGAQFSASTDYNSVKGGTTNSQNVYVESTASCRSYMASCNINLALTPAFTAAVAALPTVVSTDYSAYQNFINFFGTHFVPIVSMGSKAIQRSSFTQTAWTTMQQQSVGVSAAATVSYMSTYNLGVNASANSGTSAAATFNSIRTSEANITIGHVPPPNGDIPTWQASSGASPMPISYTLQPISNLITATNFPKLTTVQLAAVNTMLTGATQAYCNLVGCSYATPDPVIPVPPPMVSSFNQQNCVFPFQWGNKVYYNCTFDGNVNGKSWCGTAATTGGPNGAVGDWGYCGASQNQKTTWGPASGQYCVFPFTLHVFGEYTTCTSIESVHGAWCPTQTDSNGYYDDMWGYC